MGKPATTEIEGRRIGRAITFAVTLAIAMLFFDQIEAWRDRTLPTWTSLVGFACLALILVPPLLRRDVMESAIGVALIPITTGTTVQRYLDPDPPWTNYVRGAGVMLVLVVVLVVVLTSASRVRELDRLLFTEATSIAFFVTVVGATAYAGVQALLDTPRLSFAWISLFGFTVWGIAAVLLRRRYT